MVLLYILCCTQFLFYTGSVIKWQCCIHVVLYTSSLVYRYCFTQVVLYTDCGVQFVLYIVSVLHR